MKIWKNNLTLLLCAAVMIFSCAACSSGNSSKSAATDLNAARTAAADQAGVTSAAGAATANGLAETAVAKSGANNGTASNTTAKAAAASSQKIIQNLSYQIETLKFDDSVAMIQSLCTELGGYIQDSSINGSGIRQEGRLRTALFTLRVPQEKLNQLKERAAKVGSILNFTSSSENVTEKYFDTEARLKSLRTQQERLLALMQKSGALKDVIELEKALADVNYQIEELTGTLKQYDSLISYSTVTIQLSEVVKTTEIASTPVTLGDKIAQQFKDSMGALGSIGEGLLILFIGCSPIILLLAAIAVAGAVLIRRKRNRMKKRVAEAAEQEKKE